MQEVYITCTKCHQRKRLYLTTEGIERKRRRIARLAPNAHAGNRAARICEELTDQIRTEAMLLGLDSDPLVPRL